MAAKPAPPRRYCDARAGPVNPLGRFVLEPAGRMPGSVEAGDSIECCTPRHFHGADMELTPKRYMDTVVLSPVGRIDHSTSEEFKTALAPHMTRCAEGQDRVILDFGGVEYISSVGLRVLMLASKQAKAQGGLLGVAALQPAVREIFDISRFTMVLDVFPSLREGLGRLSPKALAAFDAA
jgi:anti-sigma B factor antagonist